jgi:MFS superfamily sulfate permease-like transporter
MRQQSETSLLIALLPVFAVGMFPILMIALLGFAGLALIGALLICAGLSDGLRANGDFNQEIIVHGYAARSERAVHASSLHAAARFAMVMIAAGAALALAGLVGLVYLG